MREAGAYRLVVTDLVDTIRLEVLDWRDAAPIVLCEGSLVRELVASRALPAEFARVGVHSCDKQFVWHLILAATSARMALNQLERSMAALH